jgi:hypothetical protein
MLTNAQREKQDDEEIEAYEASLREPQEETVEVKEPELSQEEETWKQRYSNLRSHSDKQANEFKDAIKNLENKVRVLEKTPTESSVPSNVDEMRKWMEDYPDLAGILKTMMREEAQFVKEELSVEIDKLEDTKRQVEANRAFQQILKVHPDFGELVNSQSFTDWIEKQPEEKGRAGQAMYDVMTNGFDAVEAIKVINVFKREAEPVRTKKDPVRSAAETVSRSNSSAPPETIGGKKQWKESEIERMSDSDFDRFEDEIVAAKREGRLVYDVTGAAR